MYRFRRVGLSALGLLLAAAFACAPARSGVRHYLQLEADGPAAGDLVVVSAASEKETREIARRIAMFRAAVESALGMSLSKGLPTRVYALSREDWERHAQPRPGVSGYFLANPFSSELLLNAEDDTTSAYELILHEYMHHLLRTALRAEIPAYLDEGLAELFGTAQFAPGVVTIGFRPDHARHLRRAEWIPFERMIAVRRSDPEYVDHALAPDFYAQAWATLYYAAAVDQPFGWRVHDYLRARQAGMSNAQATARLTGGAPARINSEIARFIRQKRTAPLEIRIEPQKARSDLPVRALTHEESTLALGELVLQFGNRSERAQELLEDVLRRQPGNSRARVWWGRAHLQSGRVSKAAEIFDETPDPPDKDAATSVALARGLFQVAVDNLGARKAEGIRRERLLRARRLFERGIGHPRAGLEAVNGYVLTCLALEDTDGNLIHMAQEAYARAPRSPELGVALALLHEVDGRKDVARRYWQEAARNTHASPMRARILDRMGSSP